MANDDGWRIILAKERIADGHLRSALQQTIRQHRARLSTLAGTMINMVRIYELEFR